MKNTTEKMNKSLSALEFDQKFESNEDIVEFLDLENAIVSLRIKLPFTMHKKLESISQKEDKNVNELILEILNSNPQISQKS
ncbi:MAG: hypothetical protein SFU98_16180 [Leptospiraceae bacterium]|nr:hypothetical protein [Leptospiraceae bacterium]